MIKVGIIGTGYWGPNLIRNFVASSDTDLTWACDLDEIRLRKVLSPYPKVKSTTFYLEILDDHALDAVAITTPVHTHFELAEAALMAGKHVLVEKPMAASVIQGERLVSLAAEKGLTLMCDHTFCYTGAVQKMKEIICSGTLGDLLYYDSVRINLGLFQQDINVVWDLAPHDLSILDFLVDSRPLQVSAHGISHSGNGIENTAYLTLNYDVPFISHLHLNWLSPVKIRKTIVCGSKRMLVWNDLEPAEKVKLYDKGVELQFGEREKKEHLLVSYRSGDMLSPGIDHSEALASVVREFASAIQENRKPLTDGQAGLRVLQILEAAQRSIKAEGANVRIEGHKDNGNGILLNLQRRQAG